MEKDTEGQSQAGQALRGAGLLLYPGWQEGPERASGQGLRQVRG